MKVHDTQMHPLTRRDTFSPMNQRESLTISLDQPVAARVCQYGARTRGGASGCLFSRGEKTNPGEVLDKAREAMEAGATGLIFGRDIWRREHIDSDRVT